MLPVLLEAKTAAAGRDELELTSPTWAGRPICWSSSVATARFSSRGTDGRRDQTGVRDQCRFAGFSHLRRLVDLLPKRWNVLLPGEVLSERTLLEVAVESAGKEPTVYDRPERCGL